MKRALLSVYDKTGIVALAKKLVDWEYEIISTGGTFKTLVEAGVKVTPLEKISNNPELFGGRMKSLSFPVYSGILFRRDHEGDIKQAQENDIRPIDVVVVNFYPFEKVIKETHDLGHWIENIDIGGPSMLRAAAKNFKDVSILSDPTQYVHFIQELESGSGETSLKFRSELSVQAFSKSFHYDQMIFQSLESKMLEKPQIQSESFKKAQVSQKLRYGENPHQAAFLYLNPDVKNTLAQAQPLQGKELSYNNYLDMDAAFGELKELHRWSKNQKQNQVTVIIKHANACGVCVSHSPMLSLTKAWNCDTKSAFGGIVACNYKIDVEQAQFFDDKFIEVLIAPDFSTQALEYIAKKKNLRILKLDPNVIQAQYSVRSIDGGYLVQEEDVENFKDIQVVTKTQLNQKLKSICEFTNLLVKHYKSNALVLATRDESDDFILLAQGSGQTNRVDCLELLCIPRLAGKKIGSEVVMASDAFFPFPDIIEISHKYNIKNIVQPGGSMRDQDVISKCDEYGIAMAFTGVRHFRH